MVSPAFINLLNRGRGGCGPLNDENILVVARWGEVGGWVKSGEGERKIRLKQSRGVTEREVRESPFPSPSPQR